MEFEHVRMQYGVGQGQFHAAHILVHEEGREAYRFDYVYDCGAIEGIGKTTTALKRCIKHLQPRRERLAKRKQILAEDVIDLLVLSHFDADHMNGAHELVNRRGLKVLRIVVPYLTRDEMLLEIARQGGRLSLDRMKDLETIASGSPLWGIPTTRVRSSNDNNGPVTGQLPNDGGDDDDRPKDFPPLPKPPQDMPPETVSKFPLPMDVCREDGTPLPDHGVMSGAENVVLRAAGVVSWRLRFWNQRQEPGLQLQIRLELDKIGFPLEGLDTAGGLERVMKWFRKSPTKAELAANPFLEDISNRDRAVDAYRMAIEVVTGKRMLSSEKVKLPNRISLAMLSAPGEHAPRRWNRSTVASHFEDHYPFRIVHRHIGWLGTGDAPLGEAPVWADFEAHFSADLPLIDTVLLPHHGAAPLVGDQFFNRSLVRPFRRCVLSVGATNGHGHPRTSVLTEIHKVGGAPLIVTERVWPGLLDVRWGTVP